MDICTYVKIKLKFCSRTKVKTVCTYVRVYAHIYMCQTIMGTDES
jgi:hypothetical protein